MCAAGQSPNLSLELGDDQCFGLACRNVILKKLPKSFLSRGKYR